MTGAAAGTDAGTRCPARSGRGGAQAAGTTTTSGSGRGQLRSVMTFGFVRRRRENRDATGTTGLAGAAVDCAGTECTAELKQDESTRSGGLRVLQRALLVFLILAPGLRRAADFAPRRWAVLRSARHLLLGSVIRPRRLSEGIAPVFQGGSSVLARRFALRISSTSRGLLFSSTLHKADICSAFSGASAIVAARPRGNNCPCVQSHCPSNPHSAHRPICEQPRGSCEVCLEL